MAVKNRGRPKFLEGFEIVSTKLGKRELRILAKHQRRALDKKGKGRSEVIRQIIRLSDGDAFTDAVAMRLQHDAEIEERDARIAELERLVQVRRPGKAEATPQAQRVLERIAAVKRHIAAGGSGKTGIAVIDQAWHNEGYQWSRVLARFEAQLRRLGPPPGPPTAPDG